MEDRMLQFFAFDDLPEHLRQVSAPFHDLAQIVVGMLPSNPERTVALRKLLEAKDCAVRAVLYKEPQADRKFETPGGGTIMVPAGEHGGNR